MSHKHQIPSTFDRLLLEWTDQSCLPSSSKKLLLNSSLHALRQKCALFGIEDGSSSLSQQAAADSAHSPTTNAATMTMGRSANQKTPRLSVSTPRTGRSVSTAVTAGCHHLSTSTRAIELMNLYEERIAQLSGEETNDNDDSQNGPPPVDRRAACDDTLAQSPLPSLASPYTIHMTASSCRGASSQSYVFVPEEAEPALASASAAVDDDNDHHHHEGHSGNEADEDHVDDISFRQSEAGVTPALTPPYGCSAEGAAAAARAPSLEAVTPPFRYDEDDSGE